MFRACITVFIVLSTSRAEAEPIPMLQKYCVGCHSGSAPKGDLLLNDLVPTIDDANVTRWRSVLERLDDGSMPPKGKPRPALAEQKSLITSITTQLQQRDALQIAKEGRTVLRRLNRVEYQNTMRDLLGVETDLKEMLPEDGNANGFDNVDAALTISPALLERYLDAAEVALNEAIVTGPAPAVETKTMPLTDLSSGARNGMTMIDQDVILFHSGGYLPTTLKGFRAPSAGKYRFKVPLSAYQSDQTQTARIYKGSFEKDARSELVDFFDAPVGGTTVDFVARWNKGDTIQVFSSGSAPKNIPDSKTYKGPGLRIGRVEVSGPLFDGWPSASHTRLLGTTNLKTGTIADAERILKAFLPRAFRRPITDAECLPFIALVQSRLKQGQSFEVALRIGLKAVLCSPKFLFREEAPGVLNDHALASRLSYFLWSSMPDDVLIGKKLSDPIVMREQVERMLNDPKSRAFTESFTGQWLDLRNIDFTAPDKKLYPEFDELLQVSMVRETQSFFDEMIQSDRSVTQFVHSDWSMLNGRLAKHYGIPGVSGVMMRKVALPANSHRGGVITHASVLKVTANGTNTSPILRGVWLLDRIMGKPVPPPPANVSAVEPDIRGAVTIREQLAKHRTVANCASCHTRIDPPGFALENFDVIGGWRDRYRVSVPDKKRTGVSISVDELTRYVFLGPSVDAGDQMPNGQKFRNVDEFKKILLADRDQIARNLAAKLLIYATGHAIESTDRDVIESIVKDAKATDYGFRTLIHRVVQSPTFRRK